MRAKTISTNYLTDPIRLACFPNQETVDRVERQIARQQEQKWSLKSLTLLAHLHHCFKSCLGRVYE